LTTAGDQPLDHAERWLRDSLSVLRPPVAVAHVSVDMTRALKRLEGFRRSGAQITTTHLLVRATARALAANPTLHQILAGTTRHRPDSVDIGLSVTGETFISPVVVIEHADQKSESEIATEIARRVPEVQEANRKMLRSLRRWGRLVPFGFLRRAILRLQFASPTFRRKTAGTFQVSTVPVDWALTSTLVTTGVLIGGRIWPRVVAIDGQPAVRPMMSITLSGDHGVWDGRAAARFLAAVQAELEAIPESPTPAS
jgi:pyruvate dehydrogenase E2 component (dihydrolipoyllysine-residue acetyltransferase)